jgi:hypothetical protein
MAFVLSVVSWQIEVMQYQFLLQALVVSLITFLIFRAILNARHHTLTPVIVSLSGDWLETNTGAQISWKITDKSRVSSLLLFIHLISPVNARLSKWCLIYKDQVTERDFRHLCRTVIYQQHTAGKD